MKNASPVHSEYYEITGESKNTADAYVKSIHEIKKHNMELVNLVNGNGYIPRNDGNIKGIVFKDKPDEKLWKKVKSSNGTEYMPKANTKRGKEFVEILKAAKNYPSESKFLSSMGWDREFAVMDSSNIYFAVRFSVSNPESRHFLKLPRQENDGWIAPNDLKLVSYDLVREVLDEHNTLAKKMREEAKVAA